MEPGREGVEVTRMPTEGTNGGTILPSIQHSMPKLCQPPTLLSHPGGPFSSINIATGVAQAFPAALVDWAAYTQQSFTSLILEADRVRSGYQRGQVGTLLGIGHLSVPFHGAGGRAL